MAAILDVHDINRVLVDHRAPSLPSQIVDATEALFENLRRHDGRADGKHHPAIELLDRAPKKTEIRRRRAADSSSIKDRVRGDDVVTDAGMDGKRDILPEGLGQNRSFFPWMLDLQAASRQSVSQHRLEQ